MSNKTKWAIIAAGEVALIAGSFLYRDGFITACAVMCGLICLHEWKMHRSVSRLGEAIDDAEQLLSEMKDKNAEVQAAAEDAKRPL
jgi:hypothetical protein